MIDPVTVWFEVLRYGDKREVYRELSCNYVAV